MANPTTNYGFVLPTSSDLVTDLPADFDVALQGVDTRLKALQPGTTLGDLAYSSATANTNTRLAIGTSGQVLAVSAGGVPEWKTTADVTPLTTKGDLFTFTTVDARIGVGANGTVLTADSAEATGLKWAAPASGSTFAGVRLRLSGSQSIPNTTDTVLNYTVENYDTDSYHDNSTNNSRITIPSGKAGYYLVFGTVNYSQVANGARVHEILYNNATTIARDESISNGGSVQVCHSISSVYYMSVGDYIEHRLYQGSGGSLDALANHTQFGAVYLGV